MTTTPTLYRFDQTAAQSAPTPNTAGVHSNWHAPGGWQLRWDKQTHGFPPDSALSASKVARIMQAPFGWTPSTAMQMLAGERPYDYIEGFWDMAAKYQGDLILNIGSPHNQADQSVWDIYETISLHSHVIEKRAAAGLKTIAAFDAFGEAVGYTIARNIHAAEALRACGMEIWAEGNVPAYLATIVKLDGQLMMHSSLTKCVNDINHRKGMSPLHANTVVWLDTATGTVEQHVAAANQVMAKGVAPDPVIENGSVVAWDEYQERAAEPESLSSAISPGMTAEQVAATWPVGGGAC